MTFNEFIKTITAQQVETWWNTVAPTEAPEKVEDDNWKYRLSKNGKSLPFKYTIKELAKYATINFKDFGSNVANRDVFCEVFNFEITEDLVYDATETKDFISFYNKLENSQNIFQTFINYANNLINNLNINPYKIRMALRKTDREAMIIIGMRAILAFKITNGKAIIGFIVNENILPQIQHLKIVYNQQFTGSDTNKYLIYIEIDNWNDIPDILLESNKTEFENEYNKIKNSRRATWNTEANSTNSVLKYLAFKGENINEWVSNNNIKMDNILELEKLLRRHFVNIWRCADSNKWNILKNDDLLTFDWIDESIDYSKIDFNTIKSGKKALTPWVKYLKKGDLIFVMGKNTFSGIAMAKSTYNFAGPFIDMGNNGVKPAIEVEYIYKCDFPINHTLVTHNNPTTFAKIDQYNFGLKNVLNFFDKEKHDVIDVLFKYIINNGKILNMDTSQNLNQQNFPKNQILYGPPGTGKTYATKELAVKIIDNHFVTTIDANLSEAEKRKLITQKYDDLHKLGQIVFTTFHQSMSYEDFVEGIKPETNDGEVSYEVQPGIFKELCISANSNVSIENFDKVYEMLLEKIENENDEMLELKTIKQKSFWVGINSNGNLNLFTTENKNRQGVLTKEKIKAFANGVNLFVGWEGYALGIVNYMKSNLDLHIDSYKKAKNNFVIIIDEINRGNVSAIFGELITLLEEDKRIGETEEIRVKLPYSKDENFGVPQNIYIIGTMNTADRSVEALDTALRRRFSFTEIMPNYNLLENKPNIEGINLKLLLETINKRIEVLLNRDHTIGHSYFLNVNNATDLKKCFANNIIPLLQEYFYNDYQKIGLIIGKGFYEPTEKVKNTIFASFETDNYLEDAKIFRLKPLNESFNIIDAVQQLLGIKMDTNV